MSNQYFAPSVEPQLCSTFRRSVRCDAKTLKQAVTGVCGHRHHQCGVLPLGRNNNAAVVVVVVVDGNRFIIGLLLIGTVNKGDPR